MADETGCWWVVAIPDPSDQPYFDGGINWIIGLFSTEQIAEDWRAKHEPNGMVLPLTSANGPRPPGRGNVIGR